VGIQTKGSSSENCCTAQFVYRIYARDAKVRSVTQLHIERTREVFAVC